MPPGPQLGPGFGANPGTNPGPNPGPRIGPQLASALAGGPFLAVEEFARRRAAYAVGLDEIRAAGAAERASRSALVLGARRAWEGGPGRPGAARGLPGEDRFAPFASLGPLARSYSQPSPIGPLERQAALAGLVRDGLVGSAALAGGAGGAGARAATSGLAASSALSSHSALSAQSALAAPSALGGPSVEEYRERLSVLRGEGGGSVVAAGRAEGAGGAEIAGRAAGTVGGATAAAPGAVATPAPRPVPATPPSLPSPFSGPSGSSGPSRRSQPASSLSRRTPPRGASAERARAGDSGAAVLVGPEVAGAGGGAPAATEPTGSGPPAPIATPPRAGGSGEPGPKGASGAQGGGEPPAGEEEVPPDPGDLALSQLGPRSPRSPRGGAAGDGDSSGHAGYAGRPRRAGSRTGSYTRVQPEAFRSLAGGWEGPRSAEAARAAGRARARAGRPASPRAGLIDALFRSVAGARGPAVSMSDLALCSEEARRAARRARASGAGRAAGEAPGAGAPDPGAGCPLRRSLEERVEEVVARSLCGAASPPPGPPSPPPARREAPFAPRALRDLVPVALRSSVLAGYREAYNSLSRTSKSVLMESGVH